jgi:peptidyl-prolyl cis-trans isomerase D
MFDFIRTHQRLMQLVLLLLILPSFVLIGVSGYTNYVSGDHDLVKVAGSTITMQEFDQARRNQLEQLQQNGQGGFDPAVLDNPSARNALLESLIDRRVLISAATRERFSVSDAALRQAIASMPQLQVNGQFSSERYNDVLASVGISTKDFEQSQRAELALDRVLGPVGDTAAVPATVVKALERTLTAQRTLRVMTFAATDYQNGIVVSDADIQAWYDKNKNSLQMPEQVAAEYLLLDEAAAMNSIPAVTPEQLQSYYEQNKSRYVQPARINLSHILVNVPVGATEPQRDEAQKKAEAIATKAQANPAAFADIARDDSQDAGTAQQGGLLGWITKGSWPPNLEQAVFSLKKGQVSDAIDGPGGFHIFLANDVQPEKGESFEEAKAKVEAEVRRQLGAERFADMATQLTSLVYDNSNSLKPAAEALGLKIRTAAGIARDRLLAADEVGDNAAAASPDASILNDVRVRRALFTSQALNEKQNSGVIEISPDTMIVIRVDSITPAHVPELGKVSDHIREQLIAERALQEAQQAGENALAALEKGEPLPSPAKSGADVDAAAAGTAQENPARPDLPAAGHEASANEFGDVVTVSRIDPKGLDKPVLDAAFHAPANALPQYVGVRQPSGYVIVKVEGAKDGAENAPTLAGLSQDLDQAWGRAEQQAVLKALRVQAKVTLLPEAEKAISGQSAAQD